MIDEEELETSESGSSLSSGSCSSTDDEEENNWLHSIGKIKILHSVNDVVIRHGLTGVNSRLKARAIFRIALKNFLGTMV